MNVKKSLAVAALSTVMLLSFSSSAFAHYCFVTDKKDDAGTVTDTSGIAFNPQGKMIIKGGFVDPAVVEAMFGLDLFPDGHPDVFAHQTLSTPAEKGSSEHGVNMIIPH